ncbi:MAG: ABC transporter permease [Helicobacteraceae bacterium]|jgi:putative ABC transport system permease protein|nr:ABC transporter permease [Helicobacteraceae bacterium]
MRKKSLVGFIARRYLRFDPSQPFISIAAILAFLGVAIGVMVLIVTMAIMSGVTKEFREKLFVMNYPITLLPRFGTTIDDELIDRLRANFPDLRFSPYLRSGAMSRKDSYMEGVIVFGVRFDAERLVNPIFDRALTKDAYEPFEAIAGKALTDEFAIAQNEKLLLIFTRSQPSGLALTPVMKRFAIAGSFESGLRAYDKAYFYAQYDDLRVLLNAKTGEYHGVHIDAKEPMDAIDKIKAVVGSRANAIGWWEQNANFFGALELEKRALFLVLMLIVLVAALNIVSSLLMTTISRRKEIALLASLGASPREIGKIFFTIGAAIGFVGIVTGSALGGAALWALDRFDIVSLPADVYGTSKLPLDPSPFDFSMIVIGAFIIVLFSAWYPAKKAAQTDVLDALRNE